MAYVVNDDIPTNKALVHLEECPSYPNLEPKNPKDGGRLGPYTNREEAFDIARATGRRYVRRCENCKP